MIYYDGFYFHYKNEKHVKLLSGCVCVCVFSQFLFNLEICCFSHFSFSIKLISERINTFYSHNKRNTRQRQKQPQQTFGRINLNWNKYMFIKTDPCTGRYTYKYLYYLRRPCSFFPFLLLSLLLLLLIIIMTMLQMMAAAIFNVYHLNGSSL